VTPQACCGSGGGGRGDVAAMFAVCFCHRVVVAKMAIAAMANHNLSLEKTDLTQRYKGREGAKNFEHRGLEKQSRRVIASNARR
jgi:hypothetical protein